MVYFPTLDIEAPLGREKLDELARPVLDRTVAATRAALSAADLADDQVDAVFLTGGSSRLTAVPTLIHREFGIAPTIVEQPEMAVAEGALRAARGDDSGDTADAAWPPLVPVRPAPVRPRWRVAAGATVLALLAAVLAYALWPKSRGGGSAAATGTSAPAAPSASPSPSVLTGPACLIGTWVVVTRQSTIKINGVNVQFGGGGKEVDTFGADGTFTVDYTNAEPLTAVVGGVPWKSVDRGVVSGRYLVEGNTVKYATTAASGEWVLYRREQRNNSGSMSVGLGPEQFSCTGNVLQQFGDGYSVVLERVRQ
jgi:hypothetical protein